MSTVFGIGTILLAVVVIAVIGILLAVLSKR